VLCSPGCQFGYEYDYVIRGTVKSASDGRPLVGVRGVLNAWSSTTQMTPVTTGNDGSFTLPFTVEVAALAHDRMPKWSLTLTKAGRVDEVIDISPVRKPVSTEAVNQIAVAAYLRER
jgi:hypothetical protein